YCLCFFFSSRRRHTRCYRDWSSDVCSSDLNAPSMLPAPQHASAFTIGVIFACGGAGSILGAFLVPPLQKRFSFGQLMIGSTWIWALTWLLFAVAPNPLILGIVTAVSFIIVPIFLSVTLCY